MNTQSDAEVEAITGKIGKLSVNEAAEVMARPMMFLVYLIVCAPKWLLH